jgi:hypothetical protein
LSETKIPVIDSVKNNVESPKINFGATRQATKSLTNIVDKLRQG